MENNRNDRPIILALIVVCMISLFLILVHKSYEITHYQTVAIVDSITEEETLMIDPCGDVWAVDNVPNAKVGDLVNLTFYTNRTNNTHEDDVITNVSLLVER